VRWLGEWMGTKHGLQVDIEADGLAEPVDENMRVLLFQAVRELLFNVVKHAKVKRASVSVHRMNESEIRIRVSDNGIGFDSLKAGTNGSSVSSFGLFYIRERLDLMGGRMVVESSPGNGSSFTLFVPSSG
jgi:signal transduction histidine kinase